MLRRRTLDISGQRRDNATTEHSADTPEPGHTRRLAGGVPRYDHNVAMVVDHLAYLFDADPDERLLLREIVQHYAAGGLVLYHDGGLVFTWADGGVSRRLAAGHWG